MKHKLILNGLNCAHCGNKIQQELAKTDGFSNVNLVFTSKTLYCEHSQKDIISLVQKIADNIEKGITVSNANNKQTAKTTNNIKEYFLLFLSIIVGIITIILDFLNTPTVVIAITSIVSIILSGYEVFVSGFKGIIKLKMNENTLMAIAIISALLLGEYIEGIMVTILFGIGEMLEDKAVNKSRKSIEALANIQPDTAVVLIDNKQVTMNARDVSVGSTIIIKPYERVSLDGVVIEGFGTLDTSAITGESLPVDCNVGFQVLSGMINGENLIKVKTTKEFKDSTANRIIKLVEDASATKSHKEKLISKFASYYTPIVVVLSIIIAIVPPALGIGAFEEWVYKALVCLVSSCPCAIVISIPLSYYSGIGAASKNGVLFKGGRFLDELAKADTIVFDKTGTLTEGNLTVTNIIPLENYSEEEILKLAASCEKNSTHPIAKAIINSYNGQLYDLENYKEKSGYGVSATYNGKELLCGNKKHLQNHIDLNATAFLIYDGVLIGAIEVEDKIRKETPKIIQKLKKLNINNLIMLTGDSKITAEKVAKEIKINDYYSELLPQDKVSIVKKLKENSNSLCFIGDGINDAPVLATSDCGFAIGMGSDAAIEAADAVLTTNNLNALPKAIKIARKTNFTIKAILIFALTVKLAVIVSAILGYAAIWLSVIADTGVCMLCVLYASRLLKIK